MKSNTYISGYYPDLGQRFLVILGGDEALVEAFNRGEFGLYKKGIERDNIQPGSFQLHHETVEMY